MQILGSLPSRGFKARSEKKKKVDILHTSRKRTDNNLKNIQIYKSKCLRFTGNKRAYEMRLWVGKTYAAALHLFLSGSFKGRIWDGVFHTNMFQTRGGCSCDRRDFQHDWVRTRM